jgi:hypothetical protein
MWGTIGRWFYDVSLRGMCKNHMGIMILDFWIVGNDLIYCGILVHMGIVT